MEIGWKLDGNWMEIGWKLDGGWVRLGRGGTFGCGIEAHHASLANVLEPSSYDLGDLPQ